MVFWQLIFSPPDTNSKLHATASTAANILFLHILFKIAPLDFVVFATIPWSFSPHIPQGFNKAQL